MQPSILLLALALLALVLAVEARTAANRLRRSFSTAPSAPSHCISPRTGEVIALPTEDQLRFQADEIAVLIHYNIATYLPVSHDGCNGDVTLTPPASAFDPYLLNTDNWVQSMQALNATAATLVVKHNCGFTTWPSKVSFKTRSGETVPYNYTIAYSPVKGTDLVREFVRSTREVGIKPGFYYSVVWNNYLNVANGVVGNVTTAGQVPITQATYDAVVLAQLTELWTQYGALAEIWFDGGYRADQLEALTKLLSSSQPHASIFNGCQDNGAGAAECVSNSSIRWIGTESGAAPDPNWSTGVSNDGGDPTSPIFCPAECDTTLQENDRWFWGANQQLRPLVELIRVYHLTVGRNCRLEMDLTPDTTGLIPARYAARYGQLGDFIRGCYGRPVVGRLTHPNDTAWLLTFPSPVAVDRVQLMEDQRRGQVVRAYTVAALVEGAPTRWQAVANGTSVGHKKIDLFTPVVTTALRLTVTQAADTPRMAALSAHICDVFTEEAVRASEMAERAEAQGM